MLTAAFSLADWDNVSLSNETLLDTVSRFVLAALLKHTGLLGQGCGEGRYRSAATSSTCTHPRSHTGGLISSPIRYQPSKSLAEVYRSVYKVRNRLLACKNMDFIQTRSSSRERRVSGRSHAPSRRVAPTLIGGYVGQISDNQDSLEMDPQEHSLTRTIDEEAELEERADREREEGHQEQDDQDEDRDHEVMTAGSECT